MKQLRLITAVFFTFLIGVIPLLAQENNAKCVMIETSQGETLEYYISSHPRLMQDNDKVTLTTDDETLELGTVEIKKVYTSIATIKVVYMLDGVVYKTYYHHAGIKLKSEPAPTKEGYLFTGWNNEPTLMPDHDVTVTGSFAVNKYKLTYQVDGVEYKSSEVAYGSTITPEAEPTKEGYTFSGWSEIPETMPAHDVTVTGTFSVNKYKLIYMVDGEEYKTSEVEYGTAITAEAEPTKEGYTFSGWSEIPETMPAHDVTVTGTFTINKYKLTYEVDGEEYKTFEVEYGTVITAEAEPTKEGYTFSGWSEIPETMPAHDVTVTGTFEKNIIMGDVNGDGVVNVTDIVATVNYIMEKPSDGFNKDAADLNGDGKVNVTDIVKMVSIIMNGNGGSSRRAAATSGNLVISGHNIQLRNADNYIAAQFDINLSDGQSISSIVLNGSSNHELYWKMIDANICRVVVYSMTNTAFGVNGDNLFNIFINGGQRATISNEILIKADGTTGIDAIHTEAENGNVYDLNGRQVKTPGKGVYIIKTNSKTFKVSIK
jgi:hypothetical protein